MRYFENDSSRVWFSEGAKNSYTDGWTAR